MNIHVDAITKFEKEEFVLEPFSFHCCEQVILPFGNAREVIFTLIGMAYISPGLVSPISHALLFLGIQAMIPKVTPRYHLGLS